MLTGFLLGVGIYGPMALYGVIATEAAPAHLSGTSHAIVAMASNGECVYILFFIPMALNFLLPAELFLCCF